MSLEGLFCDVDDFCREFLPSWHRQLLSHGGRHRMRASRLTLSEIMTLLIYFHQSQYRNFKTFYLWHVCRHCRGKFPQLLSYTRFVALIPTALMPLCIYLNTRRGKDTGLAFVDATSLVVCHNRRIQNHKVFKAVARRGKTSMGWFYGFKLHLVVNDRGELLAFRITPGNVDDREPVPELTQGLTGKLIGDRGYISSKLFHALWERGLHLVTKIRKNMHNKLMPLVDKLLLRKRAIIETINDQIKNIQQVEHTRHRSVVNAMVNVLAALIAYTHQPAKPSLNISPNALNLLTTQGDRI
ncbi:MAG: IS982 family transposase [Candidatus Competibacteraceae bacterium]|nr:IS982 family transposase [Candidatus Competibacteraceae bacterium]